MQNADRSVWLRNVLDHFAEELLQTPSEACQSWRSSSLNSLLVRAFHRLPDDNPNKVLARVSNSWAQNPLNVTTKAWEAFYFDIDVIWEEYADRWGDIKPQITHPDGSDLLADRSNTNETPFPDQVPGVSRPFLQQPQQLIVDLDLIW
jgi:hypothetical protein